MAGHSVQVRAHARRERRRETRREQRTDHAAEHIAAFRWWQLSEITNYAGPDVFSPRDLAAPLSDLLASGIPSDPVTLGL